MKLVAAHREQRLIKERQRRQANRPYRLQSHCQSIVIEYIGGGAPLFRAQEGTCPSVDGVFDLPEVATLYEADTHGISQETRDNVAEGVKAIAISRREGTLRRLTAIVKGDDLEAPREAFEDRITQVSTMATELLHALSAFWCSCCNTVKWYPDILQHTQDFDATSMSSAAFRRVAPGLRLAHGSDPRGQQTAPNRTRLTGCPIGIPGLNPVWVREDRTEARITAYQYRREHLGKNIVQTLADHPSDPPLVVCRCYSPSTPLSSCTPIS